MNYWTQGQITFCDATATLRAHNINKMTAQKKIGIKDEVNITLQGKGSDMGRETVELKVLCAVKLGGP